MLGAVALMFAADLVVRGAEQIAVGLGVPELIVGLTIVALGTSAPEIVTSLVAAARGERELAVGNAVGSNIFNILLVVGLSGVLAGPGIALSDDLIAVDLPIMVAVAVACLPVLFWDYKLDRWEGIVFLAYYAAYTVFLVLTAANHAATETYVAAMLWFVVPITLLTVATIVIRGRRRPDSDDEAGGNGARSATSRSRPTTSRLISPANKSPRQEVSTCAPSHVNPLLMMRPSTANRSNRTAGASNPLVRRRR